MAKYPFLEDAKEYIKEEGPSFDELIQDRLWGEARKRGKERVLQTLNEGRVLIRDLEGEIKQEEELFSYPIARMLVSSVGDDYLLRRYTLGEAERVSEEISREEDDKILKLSSRLDLNSDKRKGEFTVHFSDYLESTERLRSSGWKLVNQDLRDGRVYLGKRRFVRILKEKVSSIISEGLPAPTSDTILEKFNSELEDIKEELESVRTRMEEVDMGEVETELFPPCMKKLLAGQKEGENLSHEGRFALTAFLKKVGLSEDEIIDIFREAPDFDIDMASYQIQHIIGEISGTEYNPPGCDTMKTNGICFNPDSLCDQDWMNHPISYYSIKKKNEDKDQEEKEEKE
ncbi:MAG: DNA primase large subunit PriL [Candidatus Thermoplasmatota archaeon]|nr:DNA primase large subunit PriL [Candidatus Thermoplasmatota archaeon]